jgi:hypothetical protein
LRLAPAPRDEGAAAAQLARALGATGIAIVSERHGAAAAFAAGLAASAPGLGAGPVARLDASAAPIDDLVTQIGAARVQVVALAGSPGVWATDLLRALSFVPQATRPSVVAPEAFDTLAFLGSAGAAAEGLRVISRFVPAEQLGDRARGFAGAYADLHGQPPPVALYAADAAQTVLDAAATSGASRASMARALAAVGAPPPPRRPGAPPRPVMRMTLVTSTRATCSADSRSRASLTARARRMPVAWATAPGVAFMARPLATRKLRAKPSDTSTTSPFLPTLSTSDRRMRVTI